MWYRYDFLCTAAAWYIAGLFIRLTPGNAAAGAVAAGLLCAALTYLLPLTGTAGSWSLVIVFLLALILPARQKCSRSNRLMAPLLTIGAYGLLSFLCRCSTKSLSTVAGLLFSCTLTAVFAAAAGMMKNHFPPEDWPEYFESTSQGSFPIRLRAIWLLAALMAVLESTLCFLPDPPALGFPCMILGGACTVVYWGTIYCICLMTACRRERLTSLIEQNYKDEMQAFMNVIRSQRHDYNFHVQALSGLVNTGDLDACRRYLDNLVQDSAAMNTILPIKDPAIAALVYSFRVMALNDGIELHLDIQNDLSCVVTSVYETNKVIGNLLQNALDEVRGHTDKTFGIHLYILKRGENCIIHVANKIAPKSNPREYLQDIYKSGLSTKSGHEGIGLSSIRQLLSRYRGVLYSRLDDGIIHFIAKIPLRLEGELT